MRTLALFVPLGLLFAAGPVVANDEGQQAQSKAKEKKICRTYKVTGSLTRVNRICRTEAQWEAADRGTRDSVDQYGRTASGGKICTPDPADPYQGCPG